MFTILSYDDFNDKFNSEMVILPNNMTAYGFLNNEWFSTYKEFNSSERSITFIKFWQKFIHPYINSQKYYFVLCFYDGYREYMKCSFKKLPEIKSDKNSWKDKLCIENCENYIPILHKNKYILTYNKHLNDHLSILIPDHHFINSYGYHNNKNIVDQNFLIWKDKKNISIYRGGLDNGGPNNFIALNTNLNQRKYFMKLCQDKKLNHIINFGYDYKSIEEQLKYKYLIDIDGWVNTWDSFVWKLYSGSVVLKCNSIWKQWYYDKLLPWVHYVPIENDFSDIENKIQWCKDNDEKCQEISKNARNFVNENLTFVSAINYTIEMAQKIFD